VDYILPKVAFNNTSLAHQGKWNPHLINHPTILHLPLWYRALSVEIHWPVHVLFEGEVHGGYGLYLYPVFLSWLKLVSVR